MSGYPTYKADGDPDEMPPALRPLERKRLRDEFAIAALQGLLSAPGGMGATSGEQQENKRYAARAYRIADEMLEAR